MQYIFTKKDALCVDRKNPDRTVYLWVDKEVGAKAISAGTAEIPVGSELPYHTHEVEEIMFIYKGKGVAVVEGETFPLEAENIMFVPPGVKHTFKNTGAEPLVFAFFYAPPGPEQVVHEWAKK